MSRASLVPIVLVVLLVCAAVLGGILLYDIVDSEWREAPGTPTIALQMETDLANGTIDIEVVAASRSDIMMTDVRIIVNEPNGTWRAWQVQRSDFVDGVAHYEDTLPGIDVEMVEAGSGDLRLGAGDVIKMIDEGGMHEGQWTVSIVFVPTGSAMSQMSFESPFV